MKLFLLIIPLALSLPLFAAAQVKYESLISIDGISNQLSGGFSEYVSFLYGLSIALAALLAVIKIIVAGVKYMLSTLPGVKQDAKSEITGALLGLLLILGAYVILNTINPRLINGGVQFQTLPDAAKVLDRPDAIQVSAQQANELTGNLPSCVVSKDNGVGASGQTTGTTINVGGCLAADQNTIARQFSADCGKKSGTIKSRGTIISCSIPLPTGKEYEGYTIGDYSGIDQTFVTAQGNTKNYDIRGQCQKEVANALTSDGKAQQNLYNFCVVDAKDEFEEYCFHDNGGKYSSTATNATCVLPVRRAYLSDLDKELTQYKANLSDTDYEGKNLTNANDASEAVAKKICALWGGEFRDIDGSQNICVSF